MNQQQYDMWKRLKEVLNLPSGRRIHYSMFKPLLSQNSSDDMYAYMIKKVIETDDPKVYSILLSDIYHSHYLGKIDCLGAKSNDLLLDIYGKLLLYVNNQQPSIWRRTLDILIRFLPYIRDNNLNMTDDMFAMLLYDVGTLSLLDRIRPRIVREYTDLYFRIQSVFKYCDYDTPEKTKAIINHVSKLIHEGAFSHNEFESSLFDGGEYVTSDECRKELYNRIIRHTNYLKLTNGNS